MIDDPIVRGTTCARIVGLLREAGAKEVHMRISSPPFKYPCFFGTDVDSQENLIACKFDTVEEIAEEIGVDSLGYLLLRLPISLPKIQILIIATVVLQVNILSKFLRNSLRINLKKSRINFQHIIRFLRILEVNIASDSLIKSPSKLVTSIEGVKNERECRLRLIIGLAVFFVACRVRKQNFKGCCLALL